MSPEPGTSSSSGVGTRLLVAPANFAGQGRAIATAAARLPQVEATSFAIETGAGLTLPPDHSATPEQFADPAWARAHERWVLGHTHVLAEGGRALTGLHGADARGDLEVMLDKGIAVGLLGHGSDVRRPDRHLELYPHSPFGRMDKAFVAARQKYADRWSAIFGEYAHTFVTTPDLLDDVPTAQWIPSVVDLDRWALRDWDGGGAVPRVLHAPSHSHYKGSELIDPVMQRLDSDGLIDYVRIEGVPQSDMPATVAAAEIVLEQFVLGIYSVAAIEAMAAGRVVVGHVHPRVRAHVASATGRTVPVVEATPDTVGEVVRELIADPARMAELSYQGQSFVADVHTGARTADVLSDYVRSIGSPAQALQ